MRRSARSLIGVSVVLALQIGCDQKDPKREAFERVSEASARWYRAAWEKDPPTDQQAREQRRFECVWNGLVARGVDPVPDLHCLARAMTATAECQEGGKPAGKCSHVFGETCMFSSHYEEVTASCSKDGG